MTPDEFKTWRKSHYRSQAAAAQALGISPRQVFSYEKGEAAIPLAIRLAMSALAAGAVDYVESSP